MAYPDRPSLRTMFDLATEIHAAGDPVIDRRGKYSVRVSDKLPFLRGAILHVRTTNEGPWPNELVYENDFPGIRKETVVHMNRQGTIRRSEHTTLRQLSSPRNRTAQVDAELHNQFAQSTGLDVLSDAETLDVLRRVQLLLGRRWPRDIVLPEGRGNYSLPTDATGSLFVAVTERLSSQRVRTKSTWEAHNKSYTLESVAIESHKPRLVQLRETELDEHTVWQYREGTPISFTSDMPSHTVADYESKGVDPVRYMFPNEPGPLGITGEIVFKLMPRATPAQAQYGHSILSSRAEALRPREEPQPEIPPQLPETSVDSSGAFHIEGPKGQQSDRQSGNGVYMAGDEGETHRADDKQERNDDGKDSNGRE